MQCRIIQRSKPIVEYRLVQIGAKPQRFFHEPWVVSFVMDQRVAGEPLPHGQVGARKFG